MKFYPAPIHQAEGKILTHHITGRNGGRVFRKGKPLEAADITALSELGKKTVYVAELEPGDIDEDTAAIRVAQAVCGGNLSPSRPNVGRVNLQAQCLGVLQVDTKRLIRLNEIEGVTLATLRAYSVARPRQTTVTVKILPFALPESSVRLAESIAAESGPVCDLAPLRSRSVHLVLNGSPWSRQRVMQAFEGPIRTRIEALGSRLSEVDFVSIEEDDFGESTLAEALEQAVRAGAELIVLAGETAIMDARDMAPRVIERLGGEVICYGAPVDPGNLLMVAALGEVPVLGAPGCARSRKLNVIDWVLPRMLAGERLTRAEIIAMGHGGLLEGLRDDAN
jgi:hypothetical protein